MPGLAVILGQPGQAGLADALERMLAPLTYPGHTTASMLFPELGIAAGHTAPRPAGSTVGRASVRPISAIVEGEILNLAQLARDLDLAVDRADHRAMPFVLAEMYARQGPACFATLRGHWAAVIVDEAERCAVVANDTAGLRPLYQARTPDGAYLLASSPGAILAHPSARRAVDPAGLADMLAFTIVMGERTLFDGVACLPPASLVTWCAAEQSLTPRRYWSLTIPVTPASAVAPPPAIADLERFRQTFNQAVLDATQTPGWPASTELTLALSGGMDSRALLSALLAAGVTVQTLTHAVEESTDARISAEVARQAGLQHHFYGVTGEGLRQHMVDGVRMMGGRVAAIDVHPLCFLDDIASYTRAILTGMGGELYKTVVSGAAVGATTTDPAVLADAIFHSYNRALSVDADFPALLAPDWLETLRPLPALSVLSVVNEAASSAPLSAVSGKIFFEERMRKVLPKGDIIVRRNVETRHPLTSPELVTQGLTLSYTARLEGAPLRYLITRNAPQLAQIIFERDGRPMRFLFTPYQRLQDRALRRWQKAMRRWHVGTPYRRVASYRYGEWLRGPLRPVFEEVLLDPRTLARPYWRGATIRRWVAEHMEGQDRTPQLSLLFALELTLRECIDHAPEGWA